MSEQTYASHRRLDPWYHFIATPLFLVFLVISAVAFWRNPSPITLGQVVLALLLGILFLKVRQYALTVQDRVIRLEETLRMERLLPADLKARIPELRRDQFVGLRFAADAELADRVREALQDQLSGEAIKKRIQTWRGDNLRV